MTEQPQQPQPNVPPQQPQPGYGAAPQPMSPQDEKTWATLVHLSPFVSALVGMPFVGPLVIYLVLRDRGPFIRHHTAQALNFQLVLLVAYVGLGLLSLPIVTLIVTIPLLIAVGVASVVFQVIAAVKANNGEWYRYPMTPDWVK